MLDWAEPRADGRRSSGDANRISNSYPASSQGCRRGVTWPRPRSGHHLDGGARHPVGGSVLAPVMRGRPYPAPSVRRNVVGPTASPTPGQHKQPTEALDTGVGSHRPLVSTTNVKALLERKTNSLRGGDLQRLYIYPRSDKDRSDVADRFLSSEHQRR